jgi:RNA 2',3'-cyclic 3'-phosphodiesterase
VSDERARLFVALELPETARETLVEWRKSILSVNSGLRPVALEALHVTLCFLGWRPAGEIEEIADACGVVADRAAIELSLGDAVWLPSRRPRALAVKLEDRDRALEAVQAELSETLRTGGWYVPEPRPFLAHVTVARVAKGARVRRHDLPAPPRVRLEGGTVTLYRSRLGRAGARYEPLRLHARSSSGPGS